MSDRTIGLPRRRLLHALAVSPLVAREAAPPSLAYSLTVRPSRALLGDRIVATLACVAARTAEAFTFQDASLLFELVRLPPGSEPARAFPNRGGVSRPNMQVRTAPTGRQQLRRAERLDRTVDL